MITIEMPTTLERIELTVPVLQATFLNTSPRLPFPAWKSATLRKLHDLEQPQVSTGSSVGSISEATKFARTMLDELQKENIPTPAVCPVPEGSIAIIWTVGMNQLEAIFGPDKSGSFVLSKGDEVVGDGEISSDDTAMFRKAVDDMLAA